MSGKKYEIYHKKSILGKGSFGKAILVQCESDSSFAVIKQIDLSDMSKEEETEALLEAKIMEPLCHQNIICFREVYKTKSKKLCIVMEYADGGDLQTKIKKVKEEKSFLSEDEVLNFFTQICLAIKHLHDRKILHRDLKSQNIFLTNCGIVKLGDFGIAKVLSHTKEHVQTIVGTPYYLSPEIVENKPYNYKSDIWSLGILLYEMCALEPPFNGSSLHMLAMRIVKANYEPIPKRYSSKISLLIKKLLNPNSDARPTVNKILKIDIIAKRAKELLNEDDYIQEFSHTVLHNKNIFKQVDNNYESGGDQKDEETVFTKQAKQSEENKKTQKAYQDPSGDTALFNKDPLQYVNNIIGDLKDLNILDATGDAMPIKKKTPSENTKKRTPKVSQWEIREQIAK
jgi:NIMA (never in mitosis gene a)-related kinase